MLKHNRQSFRPYSTYEPRIIGWIIQSISMFHGDIKGRSYGNERVEISWESDYCLEFDWIRVVTLQVTLKNIMQRFAYIAYFWDSIRRNFHRGFLI